MQECRNKERNRINCRKFKDDLIKAEVPFYCLGFYNLRRLMDIPLINNLMEGKVQGCGSVSKGFPGNIKPISRFITFLAQPQWTKLTSTRLAPLIKRMVQQGQIRIEVLEKLNKIIRLLSIPDTMLRLNRKYLVVISGLIP